MTEIPNPESGNNGGAKTTKEKFRQFLNVINTYDILTKFAPKDKDVALIYTSPNGPRDVTCRKTSVWRPNHNTDSDAAWYDYGKKTFIGSKDISLPLAAAWASARYGVAEWSVCPVSRNAMIPKEVRVAAMAALKKAERSQHII